MQNKMRNCLLIAIYCLMIISCQESKTILYDSPGQEDLSGDFELFVDNNAVCIYQARVSKFPVNQIWPGFQRPLGQTEIASFAYFDFEGEITLKIISTQKIKTFDIRPKDFAIAPVIKGNVIEFKLSKPSQFVVEINGYHNALHVFANSVETYNIEKEDPKIHYFGPGVHEAGLINVKSNETVLIDGGAIVYGVIQSKNARNIKIIGRGILDASKIERGKAPNLISLEQVTNATIDGIILRDAHQWAVKAVNCDSLEIDNVKLIGFWRYNSDGIDIVNSKNVTVKNSFVRSFDDNIAIKGLEEGYNINYKTIKNITITDCVLWNDWGRALEIGAETYADTIKDIIFSNNHIIHFTTAAVDIQNSDRALIHDIKYENIHIESPILDSLCIGIAPISPTAWGKLIVLGVYDGFYSKDDSELKGTIRNITFDHIKYSTDKTEWEKNAPDSIILDINEKFTNYDIFIRDNIYFGDIEFTGRNPALVYLSGLDSIHTVKDVIFKDIIVNNHKLNDLSLIGKNKFVYNIFIE